MQTLANLPSPRALPLLGNLLQLDLSQLHRVLERWANEFGSIYSFQLGPSPVVVVSDPEAIQQILRQRPKVYRRLGTIEPVFKEMGITGVFSAEGEDWKRQRRLTAQALDAAHLREFFPTLVTVTRRLQKRWKVSAAEKASVDVQQDLMRYTVDVTTALAFGYDMNTLEKEGDVIQKHLEEIFPAINRRINAVFPYWRYIKLPQDRGLDHALAAVRESIIGFVARARSRMAEHPELNTHPTNLLEAMLAARDEDGAAFSDEDIHGNVLTMLLAGEDTTANSLAWMMHFMTEHAEIQERMHQEAASVVDATGMLAQIQDAEKLEYIEAVAHETMRLKPVAPLFFLESLEDVEIANTSIPKNTALMLLTLHPAMQETHFGCPQEFKAERWLESAEPTGCPHNSKAFVPFGAGPRFCPGRQLAMVEIKMVMAMLCAGFEISKPPNAPAVTELFSFTMMPQNLRVQFRERQEMALASK